MSRYRTSLVIVLLAVPLYVLYTYDLTGNPPAFFIDEALASYNAHRVYAAGQGEFGHAWPLYFPVIPVPGSTEYFGYLDPVQVYALAALFIFFAPSFLLPRLLSATAMFLASIIIGILGKRISGRLDIGVIVGVTALLTPWLFEISRLAFGASLYPLVIVLFLLFLHMAHKKERWPWWNILLLALGLALTTYTYSIGRLLGPVLALGLILFATNRTRLIDVVKTWAAYGVMLVPMLIFHLNNPTALMGRFSNTVGIVAPGGSFHKIVGVFASNYFENINPWRLLMEGDPIQRHHIPDTGPILVATFILALGGIVLVIAKYRKEPWWRYVIFGTVVSIVPASLTMDLFHMLRLGAFPVFLIILSVPAIMWCLGSKTPDAQVERESINGSKLSDFLTCRGYALILLLFLTIAQSIYFQSVYRRVGATRGAFFDEGYQTLFDMAMSSPSRPIYLVDGWEQAYIHSYWLATINGIDLSNFVHVTNKKPPVGSLVIIAGDKCDSCEPILQSGNFLLYRVAETKPVPFIIQP